MIDKVTWHSYAKGLIAEVSKEKQMDVFVPFSSVLKALYYFTSVLLVLINWHSHKR